MRNDADGRGRQIRTLSDNVALRDVRVFNCATVGIPTILRSMRLEQPDLDVLGVLTANARICDSIN